MIVRSWKDGVRMVIGITLLSMGTSALIAWLFTLLLNKRFEVLLALGVPAIFVPLFVIPLVRANLRLYRTRAELERLVGTDSLTGLANRRSFLAQATNLFATSAADIAVMMIDVDHFKRINDRCGHDNGDRVLKRVANTIASVAGQKRPGHIIVGRLGGEEFAVVVHGVDAAGAAALADRFCQAMRRLECVGCGQGTPGPTVSIGVAMRNGGESFAQVLKAADTAVYEAKARGRDRWCLAHRDSSPFDYLPDGSSAAEASVPRAPAMGPVVVGTAVPRASRQIRIRSTSSRFNSSRRRS